MTNMKRALSLLLVVLMTLSLFPLASFAAGGAADEGVSGGTSYDNGVVMKKVYENGLLTLEAYATGSSVTTETTKPVDIVLVLDQSGSMAYDFDGNSTSVNRDRRQYAMKNAVKTFIEEIGNKYSAEGDHRVAIVTFGTDSQTLQDWSFVDEAGKTSLLNKIDGLPASPSGATNVGAGMQRAETLMGTDYSYTGANPDRAKAVVVFTDGVPTTKSDFDTTVANTAISSAKKLKDAGVSIYSVGIFNGANPDELYGASGFDTNSNGTVNSKWVKDTWGLFPGTDFPEADRPAGNRFLNYLSSNFASADNLGLKRATDGLRILHYKITYTITQNFERSASGYYMTANSADGLNNVFKSISQEVGGALVELKSETVLKDFVSDYFDLPAGADTIRVHTETCTAIDANGVPTAWENDNNYEAYTAVVSGKTITVTGFDYSENWVGSHNGRPGGKKLVLEIKIVDNGTGFGTVPTNKEESGLYVGDTLVKPFPVPNVEFPYYTVHHVQEGVVVGSTNYRWVENATESLPEKVTNGFLYGGAFTDAACTNPAFTNGEALRFTPVKGENYYIWEVGSQYLRAQDYDVWRHVEGAQAGYISVVNLYMLTSIDRLQYQEAGFIVDGKSYPAEENGVSETYGVVDVLQNGVLYDEIYVKNGVISTIHGQSATDRDDGYIACLSLKTIRPDFFQKDGTVTFEPYWVTLDGVKVTGYRTRTSTHLGAGPEDSTTYKFVQSVSSDKKPVYTAVSTAVTTSMLRFSPVYMINNDADPVAPPVEEGIKVTVVDNGAVYEVSVEAGDITGQITYAGADGMLFAGWYTDEQYTVPADFTNVQQSMTVYARYVSNAYLQVAYKQQEGWFSVSSLTLISAIDGRSYRETGFIINGEKKVVSEYTGGQSGFWFGGFSFGGFGARESAGDYFDGVASDALLMKQYYPVWGLSKGDTLEITPYWVTMDGTTVTGTTRTLTYTGRTITG